MNTGTKQKILFGVIAVVVLVAVVVGAIFLAKKEEDKKKLVPLDTGRVYTGAEEMMQGGYGMGAQAGEAMGPTNPQNSNVFANRTPDLATSDAAAELYDIPNPAPYGAQPAEIEYAETHNGSGQQMSPDDQWAPKDVMTQNDALSLANAENAQWFSQNLLPNADLSCSNDGLITDGPTYEELAIFTPRLIEASIASRYFQDPPQLKRGISSDPRPTPLISASAGSAENLVWNVSSIQLSDVALQNAGAQSVYCNY